jgi:Spy/CpxP family protein refolding chaperone
MKTTFLAAGAFVVALAVPSLGAYAQQSQPQGITAQQRTTQSPGSLTQHWMRRFGNLNLSGDQQQRIQSMINQYSQAHPQGSPHDRDASRALRHEIMSVLNSDQQSQYRAEMRARHEQTQHQRGQQQGPSGQPQDQGPQGQGPPPDQGPQGQGPPPDQGPQGQGPPPDQGPQGQGPPPAQGPPPG